MYIQILKMNLLTFRYKESDSLTTRRRTFQINSTYSQLNVVSLQLKNTQN